MKIGVPIVHTIEVKVISYNAWNPYQEPDIGKCECEYKVIMLMSIYSLWVNIIRNR